VSILQRTSPIHVVHHSKSRFIVPARLEESTPCVEIALRMGVFYKDFLESAVRDVLSLGVLHDRTLVRDLGLQFDN